jgi:hypothetical protein
MPPSVADFEKLGAFYLGRIYDLAQRRPTDELLLYDSRDLVTHAVIVGMTGSGKTGLGIGLLEEAALDGVPAIAIDPKGDLGNLLLSFPALAPSDFRPWIDAAAAARTGMTPDALAEAEAAAWRRGLAEWGQDGERIERLRAAVDLAIYTPGSSAGLGLSILRSFAAPPPEIRDDEELLAERIATTVGGLLTLVGETVDPVRSRAHILLSSLVRAAWKAGQDLDLAALVARVQSPPLSRIGVMDVEAFYPAPDRFELAMRLNGLLAAPGFAAWLEGEPLDVDRLLYTPAGKPRIAIVSIAHLADAERMFVVSILLDEVLAWARRQAGTSSLRAILYMDEVAGYVPPVANPPSKGALLTLLKQARAFGVGTVLATQNPVDLDYRGLGNAGTWFLGRLQTEQDKARLLDGLEGALAGRSTFDRAAFDRTLSSLGKRVFLMHDVHEARPEVFETRWTLSYLPGPLARDQIRRLMAARRAGAPSGPASPSASPSHPAAPGGPAAARAATSPQGGTAPPPAPDEAAAGVPEPAGGRAPAGGLDAPRLRSGGGAGAGTAPGLGVESGAGVSAGAPAGGGPAAADAEGGSLATSAGGPTGPGAAARVRPVLPPDIEQYVVPAHGLAEVVRYEPCLWASARVEFSDAGRGIRAVRPVAVIAPFVAGPLGVDWTRAEPTRLALADLGTEPLPGAAFGEVPPQATKARSYAAWAREFARWLADSQTLDLLHHPDTGLTARPDESERDFRIRLQQALREARDAAKAKLQQRYGSRLAALQDRVRRAEAAVQRESEQVSHQKVQSALSLGATVVGALLGRRVASLSTLGRATTAARGIARTQKEEQDVRRAEAALAAARQQLAALEEEFAAAVAAIEAGPDASAAPLARVTIAARKSQVVVERVALVWAPRSPRT